MKPATEVHTVPAGPRWANTVGGRIVSRHRTREAAIAAGAAIASQLRVEHVVHSGDGDSEAPVDVAPSPPGGTTGADPDGGGQPNDLAAQPTADALPHRPSCLDPQPHGETMKPMQKEPRKSGTQALIGAMLAVVGGLAAAYPGNLVIAAIAEAAPALAQAVPTVLTALGAIIAAFSAPPRLTGSSK
jgi:hypothetical protein